MLAALVLAVPERLSAQEAGDSGERAGDGRQEAVAKEREADRPEDQDGDDVPSVKEEPGEEQPGVWHSTAADQAGGDAPTSEPNQLEFHFSSASWRDVLEWFAGAAQMNLNWREMPEGELNLITRGTYRVEQAQDVLNMHLLARGFTLLERDGALFLVKLDESLNPTMVPRVDPDALDMRGAYEFVKVSLPLDWMLAEEAAKELAPILSPYGKIIPLTATNRIEAMDAVSNLRELRNMLQREQSDHSQDRLVAEFPLRHASAVEVVEKLNQLLGIEKPPARMSRDQMRMAREQMVLRAEMVKRLGEQAPPFEQKTSDVHLVVNERQNSILANAPPDKIAIIRQAILALDVATDDQGVRLTEVTTMRVYPLNGAEADAVVRILEDLREIGKLHPSARFSEDDDRQIVFAYASLQDHLTIQSVMDQLAGTARSFQVLPLRQLKATYVTDSIRSLMQGVGESGRGENRNRRWGGRRDRRSEGNSNGEWNGFRVEPDLPNNRLFLFATAAEMQQVEELLVKLGERSGLSDNQRIISVANDSIDETIERVRSLWPTMSSHPLRIEVPGHEPAAHDSSQHEAAGEPSSAAEAEQEPEETATPPRTRNARRRAPPAKDAAAPKSASDAVDSALAYNPAQPPAEWLADLGAQPPGFPPPFQDVERAGRRPVYIRKGPDGELILRSDDPQALDQLESLIWSSLPQTKPYAVFRLEHVSPYSVQLTLEEIFAADDVRASVPLKFVSDTLTKSIMVFGAGVSELREIEDLIEFYDQPLPVDTETSREPRFIELEYARAETVAEIIKELYRDLLSPNDPALQQQRGDREGPTFVPVRSGDDKQLQFKGMLSIGTFPDTNTMIVSAPQYLADEIEQTVRELDRDEAATVTTVVELNGLVNGALLVEQLTNAISPTTEARRNPSQQRQQSSDRQANQRRDRDGAEARARSDRRQSRWRENGNGQNTQGRGRPNGQRSGTFRFNRNLGSGR